MMSSTRNDFLTARDMREKKIDVYARRPGEYENINYNVVDTFDNIDFVRFDNVRGYLNLTGCRQ